MSYKDRNKPLAAEIILVSLILIVYVISLALKLLGII